MRAITSPARLPSSTMPLSASLALLEIGRGVGQPSERRISVGDDRSERLVDFMGDGSRELAHGREPRHSRELRLRLVHGRVGADALGLVHRDADVLDHVSGLFERFADAVKVLDRPVAQHGAERESKGFLSRIARALFSSKEARSSG